MQICEFYRNKGTGNFQCFQGNWIWTQKFTDQGLDIEWTDLFGQHDNVTFAIKTPSPRDYCFFYLISQSFGLVKRPGCSSDSEVSLWTQPNGDISFLLYSNESRYVHCRLKIINLRIAQLVHHLIVFKPIQLLGLE
uniref:Uncharacterized protein n=1 Tax=Ditylenchus dipsaci TaxID=166011 RepID=A0A915ETG6_9BILA